MMSCRARWRGVYISADVKAGCAGLLRGLLVAPLQALSVLAITARSPQYAAVTSGAIAAIWLANVSAVSRGSAYKSGFVVGSAIGSAVVVWLAR